MKKNTAVLVLIGMLMITQSSCVKKGRPVTGSAGLEDQAESSFVESDAPSASPFSDDRDALREETIREEAVFQPPTEDVTTERTPAAELEDIFFDYDRAALTSSSEVSLRKNAQYLMQFPKTRIRISGHTDERGSNEYNLALGARRARTVKQFLEAFGVEPSRIEIISYGEEKPFCHESRESCYQQNRRAHFLVKPDR